MASVYSVYTLWIIPDIRPFVFEWSKLKIWAIPLAVLSGIIEEVFFRKIIMDAIQGLGYGVLLQTFISATIFAAAHLIWVLFSRDWRFILPVLISTFVLGVLLSLAYVASDRVVLPVIVAHIVINLIIEPGLLYNSAKEANKT
ncbi:CPBP family intramembrane glutamic endopeptidase [Geomicrobium sp. JCM 19055]|uniref:CPBP family intramembrane glutamic endopeptidase n=1 Tax=Geomicrobium sp. JCM 19055 TaxID=1460649 RepID=UPI00187C5276|nr:CPBP family intramembrane glutamic endopeptidase [Geomicrobium sp. JCM 19055]